MKKKNKKSNSLKDRLNNSYKNKDKGGGNRVGVFDYKKVPDAKFFSPNLADGGKNKGKNTVSIVPYEVKTKNDPLVRTGDAKIGDLSYVYDYYSHTSPITKANILCMKGTFNRQCPICAKAEELKKNGKKDQAYALKASRRCAYNIFDHNHPENGVQIFEVSHFLFEKELIEEARGQSDGDDFIDFTDPEDGKAISFRAEKTSKSFGEGQAPSKFTEFKGFNFVDRPEALEQEVLDAAVSFDEIVKVPSEKDIEKLFYGDDDKGDDEEDEDSDDEESDDEDDDEDSSSKASSKGKKKSSKHSHTSDDEDDDEDDSDEEENDDDSEDDDESDDEEESEDDDGEKPEEKSVKGKSSGKSSKKVKEGECPFGHKFGKDCDKEKYEEDCDECDNYKECKIAFKKAQGKK